MSRIYESPRTECPLCGISSAYSSAICDLSYQGETVSIVECSRCGLVYKKLIPSNAGFGRIYNADYVHYSREDFARSVTFLASRLDRLPVRRGRLLDYGCGNGSFVQAAQEAGFDAYGLDPFLPDNRLFNNDHLAARCYRSDLSTPTAHPALALAAFDVVTMWATAEHSVNPGVDLAKLAGYLKPGGYLVFNSPAGDSLACRKACTRWNMALLPEHLQFFTRKSVLWVEENAQIRVMSVRNCGSPYPLGLSTPASEGARVDGQTATVNQERPDVGRTGPVTVTRSLWHRAYHSLYRKIILEDSLKLKMVLSDLVGRLKLGDHIEIVLRRQL